MGTEGEVRAQSSVTRRLDENIIGIMRGWVAEKRAELASPLNDYYILTFATLFLVVVGLVMVLSASSVESFRKYGSSFTEFFGQAQLCAVGLIALVVCSRISPGAWRRFTVPIFLLSAALNMLVFVPGLGVSVGGNQNWLAVGPVQGQPSELAKLAMILMVALTVARREKGIRSFKVLMAATAPATASTIGIVIMQRDLGTAMVMLIVLGAVLWVGGVPVRFFGLAAVSGACLTLVMVLTSPNRMRRVEYWLSGGGSSTDIQGTAWQAIQGKYALATGGIFGIGLGASREKWQWLPAAKDDFIFAVTGEELGLLGTVPILLLFFAIAISGARLARRATDLGSRLTIIGIVTWIIAQASVNIAVVLGLLPVLGVTLPFISMGGSSLVLSLVGMGILLSFARHEPDAAEALKANRRWRGTAAIHAGPRQPRQNDSTIEIATSSTLAGTAEEG
ncbi:putative lipid II flippase FtsW [Kineosporiaceae bacterium B12]|nr:putative lipid II flippase FtsW [Kineococcus rubinsiae]